MIVFYVLAALFVIHILCSVVLWVSSYSGEYEEWLLLAPMSVPMIGAAVAFIAGVFGWLKNGTWYAIPTGKVLEWSGLPPEIIYQPTNWIGIDRMASWILNLNVGWTLAAVSVVVAVSTHYWYAAGSAIRIKEKGK